MTQEEILKNARTCLGPYCKGCPVCNGRACKNTMPGPGAKGEGDTAIRNYEKWREIRVQMDTLCENRPVDTSLELFGKQFAYPFFAGPVGAVNLHYGDKYDDAAYNDILVRACADNGIAAFTGDGHQAVSVMLSCNGIVLNYAFVLYNKAISKIDIVSELAAELSVTHKNFDLVTVKGRNSSLTPTMSTLPA